MFCLNWLMLVDSTILFGKKFHIFIEQGKNECEYVLTVMMAAKTFYDGIW